MEATHLRHSYEEISSTLNIAIKSDKATVGDGRCFIECVMIDNVLCVTKIETKEEFRRMGLARKLLKSIEHRPVFLQCHPEGASIKYENLLDFYKSVGFVDAGRGFMFLAGDCK